MKINFFKNIFSKKATYVVLAALSVFVVSLKMIAISHSKNKNSNTSSSIVSSKDVPPVALNVNVADTGAVATSEIENKASPEPIFARLAINGDQIGFFYNSYMTASYFTFFGSSPDATNTYTIDNEFVEAPYYRIIKGDKRDWLVVTKISVEGTGIMEHEDDWYIIDSKGSLKKVLSYPSVGYIVDNPSDTYLWNADVLNEDNLNDSAVDIKRIEQQCADVTNDKPMKGINCTVISQIDHYVWNIAKEEFVLSNKPGSKEPTFHYFESMGPGMWGGSGLDVESRKAWSYLGP